MAHLTFFYKVAEGVVPAMPADIDMVLFRGKRQIIFFAMILDKTSIKHCLFKI